MGEFVHENDAAFIIPISVRTDLLTCAIMMMNLTASCDPTSKCAFVTTNVAESVINSTLRVAISAIVCEFHFLFAIMIIFTGRGRFPSKCLLII